MANYLGDAYEDSFVFRTVDSGESWQYIATVPGSPENIQVVSPSSIYINPTYSGNYLHSKDGGLSWVTKAVEGKERFLYPVNESLHYCICGFYSEIVYKVNDEEEYSYQKMEEIPFFVHAVSGITKQDGTTIIWMAGSDGKVGKFTENSSVDVDEKMEQLKALELVNVFPNPFNPATTISFTIFSEAHVNLSVYDITGRKVAILVDHSMRAGRHSAVFNASDFTSGVYFYRLQAGGMARTGKMLMIK